MRRVARIGAWTLAAIAGLLVIVVCGVVVFGNTERGRSTMMSLTSRMTGGSVTIEGLGGFFPQHLTAARLRLRDERGVWLTAAGIALDWTPLACLGGRLRIDEVRVADIDMQRLPQSSAPPAATEPSLPRIDVVKATIGRLHLSPELAGESTTLSAQGGYQLRSLSDMSVEVQARRVDSGARGDYSLHLHFDKRRMDAKLLLWEPENGPLENLLALPGLGAMDVQLDLEGPRELERLNVTLQAGSLHGSAMGTLDLRDSSANLKFDFEAAPMRPRADLAWEHVAMRGQWQGTVQSPRASGHLDAAALRLPGGAEIAKLAADLSADGGVAALDALFTGLKIPGPQPSLLANAPLRVQANARLSEAARPVELTVAHPMFVAHAQLVTAGEQSAEVQLQLPNLAAGTAPFPALARMQLRGSASVKAHIHGTPHDLRAVLEAGADLQPSAMSWALLVGGHPSMQLSAQLTDQSFNVDDFKFAGAHAALRAQGSASRPSSLAANAAQKVRAKFDADLSDLHVVAPVLTGNAQISGDIQGSDRALAGNAHLRSSIGVRGSARGDVRAELQFANAPAAPRGTLTAEGTLDGSPLELDIAMEPSQGLLHTTVRRGSWKSAHLQGEVTSAPDGARPRGALHLQIADLADLADVAGMTLTGAVAGNLELSPTQQSTQAEIRIDTSAATIGAVSGSLHLSGRGDDHSFPFALKAQAPDLRGAAAEFAGDGVLNLSAHELVLTRVAADYRGQQLHLAAPAHLNFTSGLAVDHLTLVAQQTRLDIAGELSPLLSLRADLRGLGPGVVNMIIPDLLAAGSLDAHAQLHGQEGGSVSGDASLSAAGVRFADDAALGVPALQLNATSQLQGDSAALQAHLSAGSGSELTASGRVPLTANGTGDVRIAGRVDMGLLNPMLEAHGQHATGQVAVDAAVTGSPQDPQIGGSVEISGGSLRDYARGISLTDIKGRMIGKEGTLSIQSLTAAAAPGSLAVSGTIGLLQPKMPVDLVITGKNAQPLVSKLVTANLNADLRVRGTARERLDIAGTLHLNRTLIGVPNALPPNVAVLDVRRRGKKLPHPSEKPLIIGLDVVVEAPNDLLVQGRGLDAELGGRLHVSGTTDAPIISGGFDRQRGSFSLASSKLNFTEGHLGFDGAGLKNKIDPTLDFTAQSTVGDVTVTVVISGYADAPQFQFTSNPVLQPDEIMARLLFGTNAASLTALQLAQIGAALASVGGVGGDGGANPLVKLQKSLGLDRLSVGSGTAANGETSGYSIEAGRYVSKRVYIEAKQNTTGSSQIGAVVDLTKRLKLQTRLGTGASSTASAQGTTPDNDPGSSVGLVYQFEY